MRDGADAPRDPADRTARLDRRGRRGALRGDRLQPVPGGGRRAATCSATCTSRTCSRPTRHAASRVVEDKWIRPFALVHDDDLLHDTLEKLQRRGAHMARVVDAAGTTLGAATLEDVIEELVGEIRDSAHLESTDTSRRRGDAWDGQLGCPRRIWQRRSPGRSGEGAGDGGGRGDTRRARVDRPERAQRAASARRAAVPVARAGPRGRRLGARRADAVRASPTTSTATSPAGSTRPRASARSSTRWPTASTSWPW